MTFEEIERLLGLQLPNSKRFPAWWSNNPSNNTMTRAWLDAGFTTEQVDTAVGRVVFRRAAFGDKPDGGWLADLRAAMGGTVQVAEGWDLTNPTGEIWDAQGE